MSSVVKPIRHVSLNEKFLSEMKNIDKQYFETYVARINNMIPIITEKMRLIDKDFELYYKTNGEIESGKNFYIIGVVVKQYPLLPNAIEQLENNNYDYKYQKTGKYVSQADEIFIEDLTLRIKCNGNIDKDIYSTGCVICAYGYLLPNGIFHIEKTFDDFLLESIASPLKEDVWIAFISGLSFGSPQLNKNHLKLLNLLLSGLFSSNNEHYELLSKVSRVVIAGNSLASDLLNINYFSLDKSAILKDEQRLKEALETFDSCLENILNLAYVDLIPGEEDLCGSSLPQKPYHYGIIPKSSCYENLYLSTNPYYVAIEDVKIFGTTGKVADMFLKFTKYEDPLDYIKSSLKMRQSVLAAPDNLDCYPFVGEDPFIFHEIPNIIFSSNHNEFKSEIVNGTLCFTIPNFLSTSSMVLVNLSNLDCRLIKFA